MAASSNNSWSGDWRAPADPSRHERPPSSRRGRAFAHRLAPAILFLSCAGACAILAPQVGAKDFEEYRVKAAFLYNFAKFVDWPAQSFKSPDDPIAICIVGQNPFGNMLEDTVRGKKLEGRGFVVRIIRDVPEAGGCHVLFVSSSERQQMQSILAKIGAPGVLTVGETEGFAKQGGVINLKLDGGMVRFEINVDAAAKQGLQIRSNLLNLAEIVRN